MEKRNIAVYILGIMMYKFGLEAFNGSIVTLATNRYDYDAWLTDTQPKTFQRVGFMVGLNQACQCIGSILIAPLIRRFPSRLVLAGAVLVFFLLSALPSSLMQAQGVNMSPQPFAIVIRNTTFTIMVIATLTVSFPFIVYPE
ncbi:hypothetical protein BJX99DRAFT_101212 [Aspergillus californicus]